MLNATITPQLIAFMPLSIGWRNEQAQLFNFGSVHTMRKIHHLLASNNALPGSPAYPLPTFFEENPDVLTWLKEKIARHGPNKAFIVGLRLEFSGTLHTGCGLNAVNISIPTPRLVWLDGHPEQASFHPDYFQNDTLCPYQENPFNASRAS